MKTQKTALASIFTLMFSSFSGAQESMSPEINKKQENDKIEVIEVRGIKGALGRAMDAKQEAGGVVDSISAEDIGKFPDTNLAESLQRITGVSIDRSGGEGQLITVRGFGPQFNTVLLNGRQVATAESTRAFSFDTISAELVKNVNVHKTSSAATQSGGIGSTVNVQTAKPFDIDGFKATGSIKSIYDENTKETTPQISGLISNTFNEGTFGVLFAASHQERETKLEQAEIEGWVENATLLNPQTHNGNAYTGNTFFPRNYNQLVKTEQRERTNLNLVLQYMPSDDLLITADVFHSQFDIKSNTEMFGHWFTGSNFEGYGDASGVTVDDNGTVIDLYQEVGLATEMQVKRSDNYTETNNFGLNVDWDVSDNLNMQFDFNHSQSDSRSEVNGKVGESTSILGYANRVRFQLDDNILPYVSDFTSANPTIYSGQQEKGDLTNETPAGVSDHLDPANIRPHVMRRSDNPVEDTVNQFRWNSLYLNDKDNGLSAVKFGAMYSSETKTLDSWNNKGSGVHCTFCGYPDEPSLEELPVSIFDAGSSFLSNVTGSDRLNTSWLTHIAADNFALLEQYSDSIGAPINFDATKRNSSYEITEKTLSLYTELDFEVELNDMPLSATAGLRFESTQVDIKGTNEPVTGLVILDKTSMLAKFGDAQSIAFASDYEAILPNISFKLEINDNLIARLAASQTITRPTLSDMSPVTSIRTTRQGGNLTFKSGNPELEPLHPII